ncbi:P-loop containing nucleoside triphosphate hydrolase protein [Syncephalis pseudoplumigaleata]|uniref:P-loop containing nucleoside triphosphate hydrolase protein n=1 Tax=Syncephalis pseudoplumigaleata TaxID=1712513 RepID=A0A4P9Z3L1_9FUNG|nr:P-loop containing nucleoside triphosphate hydrolase protein [Syncephalis pseudoplumigaleata]|eukprot:RKP26381.1 P-loop containing nucleoside triphosphate hydrolase protein [Syncephalis pseudoplumigaleata]
MLRVLQLDIKLNLMTASGRTAAPLEPGSLAPLFEDRLASALRHLTNLYERVSDTSFKVIVAGDVNAGKSSVVNALLRRTVVPVDQQPLTSTFLEVLDARLNDNIEEAHACEDRRIYDRLNEATFWRIPLRDLEETVAEWTGDEHSIIKVYARQADDDSALVHNDGVANLSVIDSPGLNTDSIKTFFLLARQEEIDVVVFVLNAENTLTLSGREFLEQASKEKAHLFFIVNRFEGIRAKDRCSRRILEQIREVSPKTYDEARDLVHWISPTRVRLHDDDAPDDWKDMERALRNFTLGRRARTKLEPAKIYLLNILADLRLLARMNRRDADQRLKQASDALEASRPGYEKLVESQRDDCTTADKETEAVGDHVRQLTRRRLRTVSESFEIHGGDPAWPGFTGMLGYVDAIRDAMLRAWEHEVGKCEQATLERVQHASARIATLGADTLTEPARTADLSRLFSKHHEQHRQLNVRIELWDLVEIRERIGIATAGLGSVAMIISNVFGYKSLLLNAAQVGSTVGLQGAKRWFLFSITLAGVGAAAFVIGDMQYAVHRKVARKIREHIREVGLIDQHADRVAKRAQAALRFSAQDLRERYQRAVEAERHQREQRAQDQLDAKERRRWFRDMARRAKELQELVDVVDCDDRKVSTLS